MESISLQQTNSEHHFVGEDSKKSYGRKKHYQGRRGEERQESSCTGEAEGQEEGSEHGAGNGETGGRVCAQTGWLYTCPFGAASLLS